MTIVDSGKIKIYCIDTIDTLSFYNESMHPSQRIHNYVLYDKFLNEELVPQILNECNTPKLGVAGCSFGGYHAANFALKHPDKTKYLISMGGAFDIKPRLDGFYNEEVFFNSTFYPMPRIQICGILRLPLEPVMKIFVKIRIFNYPISYIKKIFPIGWIFERDFPTTGQPGARCSPIILHK